MMPLRYLSPLVLALGMAARPSQAQKTDLTPLLPVQPLLLPWPNTLGKVTTSVAAPTATEVAVARRCKSSVSLSLPVLLINSKVLVAYSYLSEITPDDIEKVDVYKGGSSLSATTPTQWRGLDTNGIIVLTLKKKGHLKNQTLAQLGRHLQAQEPVSYTVNGLPTANGALRIAIVSITEIKLARTLNGTTIGVWLSQESSKPIRTYPPGTIMIRGRASR